MSDLKDTLFGTDESSKTETSELPDGEIEGQVTLGDPFEPVFRDVPDESSPSPEEMIRDSMSAVEQMKNDIEAENKELDKRFAKTRASTAPRPAPVRRPVYVIGVLSSAASLIFMGIALLISVSSSPIGAYAALKLSPIMLVFLGAEILYAVLRKHSLRIKIDIRSTIIITALIVISSVLSVVSVISSSGTGERVYAEQRIQNMLANELRDTIARDYIRSVDIETQLFGENAEMYDTPSDLTNGDLIDLTINFADAQMTIREFSKDCKDIIDDLQKLPYNFGTISFIADDNVNHYALKVDWHYQSGFSEEKLSGLVNYFGNGISDNDIPDITDED